MAHLRRQRYPTPTGPRLPAVAQRPAEPEQDLRPPRRERATRASPPPVVTTGSAHPRLGEPGRYAVIDVETTGLNPDTDRLVSVAVVPVDGDRVHADHLWECLVDPGRPIPAAARAIHGIDDSRVLGAPSPQQAVAGLRPRLAGRRVVGHNVGFDAAFLRHAGAADWPELHPDNLIDTRDLSRALDPDRQLRHTLDAVAERLGVVIDPHVRHTAGGDALATAECLVRLNRSSHHRSSLRTRLRALLGHLRGR